MSVPDGETADLGYISVPALDSVPTDWHFETKQDKLKRKLKENPFIPIGMLATAGVLSRGLWHFKSGDQVKSQKMMRMRVACQGFTVIALLGGIVWSEFKQGKKKPAT